MPRSSSTINNSADGTSREGARAAGPRSCATEPYQGKGNVVRAHVSPTSDGRNLCARRRRSDLRSLGCRRADRAVDRAESRHGGRHTRVAGRGRGRFRAATARGNRGFQRDGLLAVRSWVHRHPVGISRRVAALREILSSRVRRDSRSRPSSQSTPLDLKLAVAEVPLRYGARPEMSESKLRTYRDGTRIMLTILRMYRALHPLRFFGSIAIVLALVAIPRSASR